MVVYKAEFKPERLSGSASVRVCSNSVWARLPPTDAEGTFPRVGKRGHEQNDNVSQLTRD